MRTCTKCGNSYETEHGFHKRSQTPSGYDTQCRWCRREQMLNRSQRAAKHKNQPWNTKAGYEALLKKQKGKCAICKKKPEKGRGKKLHWDHDHKTGLARQLLCHYCNVALGCFQDDVVLLRSAIKYLEQHAA